VSIFIRTLDATGRPILLIFLIIISKGQLYYWRRNEKSSTAEVDFLTARKGALIPVEVKSGRGGKLKSFHLLLKKYPNIKFAICMQNINQASQHENIYYLPLYTKF
jgi:predicted AAA+ superfamily ATPase